MELLHKSLPFQVKAMGTDGPGTFELYAAVFGNVDHHRDVIMPGAFKNLDAFIRDGWGAINHNNWSDDLGIATIDEASQDSIGLNIKGTFHSTEDAQKIRTKIRERMDRKKSVKCSFGYSILESAAEMRDGESITVLKGLDIFEFSFVTMPANHLAGVIDAKGGIPRLSDVTRAVMEIKAGRKISAANMTRLKGICDTLHTSATSLKTFMDEHSTPTSEDSADPGEPTKSKAASHPRLAVLKSQLTLLSLDPARHRDR
jgi:HK97 family phage prohead protease